MLKSEEVRFEKFLQIEGSYAMIFIIDIQHQFGGYVVSYTACRWMENIEIRTNRVAFIIEDETRPFQLRNVCDMICRSD